MLVSEYAVRCDEGDVGACGRSWGGLGGSWGALGRSWGDGTDTMEFRK